MEYKINSTMWSAMFGFPKTIVENHIKLCSGNALKVLLIIFKMGETIIHPQELSQILGISNDEVFDSLNYWAQEGIISPVEDSCDSLVASKPTQPEETKKIDIPQKRPRYTREEVIEIIKSDKNLQGLVDMAQSIFNKTVVGLDMGCLVALYSYYGLSAHFITMVMQYCASINKRSMAYVEKTATNWFLLGVDDNNINSHMDNMVAYQTNENRVRKVLGISDRVISAKDKERINRWCSEFKVSDELLLYSNQITLENTGKVALSYQDTILTRWHSNSITTLEQAKSDSMQYLDRLKTQKQSPKNLKLQDPNDPFNLTNIENLLEQQFAGEPISQTNSNNEEQPFSIKNIQELSEMQFIKK